MTTSTYGLGIDIGGTNVKMRVVRPSGETLREGISATAQESVEGLVTNVAEIVKGVEAEFGAGAAVGISSPGLVARDGRSIVWMMGRMEMLMGLDWTQRLGRSVPVPVLNDAHAALLGEVWCGAAAGARNAVMLTLGTGVGGAILCDGRLLKGHMGRAGHLGHLSMDAEGTKDIVNTPGSLEDAIGECTLAARGNGKFASTKQLVEAVKNGDKGAEKIWMKSVKTLAAGIAGIVNAVDPEVVIIGGGMIGAGDALFGPLATFLDAFEWRPTAAKVRIVQAKLGDGAGAYGAAWSALQQKGALAQ